MAESSQMGQIRQALEQGNDRPVYMVLRHVGIEPRAAVHALCAAGLTPKRHSAQCRELAPEQLDAIVANTR
jgi:hypothetical protein